MTSVPVTLSDHFPTNIHYFSHYHAIIFQNLKQNVWSYFFSETYFAQNLGACLIKRTVIHIEKQLINNCQLFESVS